jgi:hypothetical protein
MSMAVPTQGAGDQFEIEDQADQVAGEAASAALEAVLQNASGEDHVGLNFNGYTSESLRSLSARPAHPAQPCGNGPIDA